MVTFDRAGLVTSYCADHAEDKAGEPGKRIIWMSPTCAACGQCYRVVATRLIPKHFNLQGVVCRGWPLEP